MFTYDAASMAAIKQDAEDLVEAFVTGRERDARPRDIDALADEVASIFEDDDSTGRLDTMAVVTYVYGIMRAKKHGKQAEQFMAKVMVRLSELVEA
jgi:hypothetical protein